MTQPLSDRTMSYAETLTGALLGLDALYAREQGKNPAPRGSDIERLVVVDLSGAHVPRPFADYADAIAGFGELARAADRLTEPDRQLYYRQTCQSAIAFATWRHVGLPFEEQLAGFLHVPAVPASDSDLDRLKSAMRTALNDLGYSGDLSTQFEAWEARHRVPANEVGDVMRELLSLAWDATAERMEIPASKSDGMMVETTTGVPYNAMCDFNQRMIRLNVDPVLTLPGLRHLAVHEGYPGHYVQFTRRQVGYKRGYVPADALLSVVNTASSSAFEGIADVGLDVIGWESSPDDHLAHLLTMYRSAIGTRAAWRLQVEQLAPSAVRDALAREALGGGDGWIDNRLAFVNAPDRAALIWSYWHGDPGVRSVWDRVRGDRARETRWFDYLYDRMHSIQSLALFAS